jgi:hypothetical protein
MVADSFGQFSDFVGELKRLQEIFELKFLFKVMFLHHAPIAAKLGLKLSQWFAF